MYVWKLWLNHSKLLKLIQIPLPYYQLENDLIMPSKSALKQGTICEMIANWAYNILGRYCNKLIAHSCHPFRCIMHKFICSPHYN